MKPTENPLRKPDWKSKLVDRLHDPLQLRVCVAGAVLLAGYFAVYTPLAGDIDETTRKLTAEQKMVDLAAAVEELRTQYARFQDRLPAGADANEWVEHVLNGMRKFPVRLVSMDRSPPRDVGPYKAVVLQIEAEGAFFAPGRVSPLAGVGLAAASGRRAPHRSVAEQSGGPGHAGHGPGSDELIAYVFRKNGP